MILFYLTKISNCLLINITIKRINEAFQRDLVTLTERGKQTEVIVYRERSSSSI